MMSDSFDSPADGEGRRGSVRALTRWYMRPLASNPGLLPLHPWRYWRCFPLFPTLHLFGPLAMIALAVFVHWSFALAAGVWLLVLILFWIQRYVIADGGDLCPAMVVHVKPFRIAVRADLTFGWDSWPVIKVVEQPLPPSREESWEIDARVPSVAVYVQMDGLNHWADIHPFAAPCLTGNASAIRRAHDSIPEEEWQALRRDWTALGQPDQPGLYHLRPDGGCNISVRLWRSMRRRPPIMSALFLLGPLLIGSFYPAWWIWWLTLLGVFGFWAGTDMTSMTARYSFPCAAKLVDQNAGLVAVYANLDASGGFYPTLKVVEYPAWLLRLAQLREGDRVAMVALCSNKDTSEAFWTDLSPHLVAELTDDPREAERVLARVPQEAWQRLEEGLKQLPQPLTPGLLRLRWPDADWPEEEPPEQR